jgi:nitrite reductase/ring-hydroxylating ferredoxin subunit
LKLIGRVARARIAGGELVQLEYPPWHVLVTVVDGEPVAIEDSCNHAGASLTKGSRDGDRVVCPLHGYVFALETGELLAPRGLCDNQRRFIALVEGEDVAIYDPFEVILSGV